MGRNALHITCLSWDKHLDDLTRSASDLAHNRSGGKIPAGSSQTGISKQIIDPYKLQELDTTEIAVPFGNEAEVGVQ